MCGGLHGASRRSRSLTGELWRQARPFVQVSQDPQFVLVGGATTSTRPATFSGQAGSLDGRFDGRMFVTRHELELVASSLGLEHAEVRDDRLRPAPGAPERARAPPPVRKPALLQKSSAGTKVRGDCLSTANTCLAWVAISGAPRRPAGGSWAARSCR